MAEYADLIFLLVALPFTVWAAWSDFKYMRLPNVMALALFGVFLVVGPFLLPLDTYLWRIAGGVIVLVITFTLFAIGLIGGGDAKYAAAVAPFVDHGSIGPFLLILCGFSLLSVFVHVRIKKSSGFTKLKENYASFTSGNLFPFGVAISLTVICYQILRVV